MRTLHSAIGRLTEALALAAAIAAIALAFSITPAAATTTHSSSSVAGVNNPPSVCMVSTSIVDTSSGQVWGSGNTSSWNGTGCATPVNWPYHDLADTFYYWDTPWPNAHVCGYTPTNGYRYNPDSQGYYSDSYFDTNWQPCRIFHTADAAISTNSYALVGYPASWVNWQSITAFVDI
jgi:hypothetical protein